MSVAGWKKAIYVFHDLADGPRTFSFARQAALWPTLDQLVADGLVKHDGRGHTYSLTDNGADVARATSIVFSSEHYGYAAPPRLCKAVSRFATGPLSGIELAGISGRSIVTLMRHGVTECHDRRNGLPVRSPSFSLRERWGRACEVLYLDRDGAHCGGVVYADDPVAGVSAAIEAALDYTSRWMAIVVGDRLSESADRIASALFRGAKQTEERALTRVARVLPRDTEDVAVVPARPEYAMTWLRRRDMPSIRAVRDVDEKHVALLVHPGRRAWTDVPVWSIGTVRDAGGDGGALVKIARTRGPHWAILPRPRDAATKRWARSNGIRFRSGLPGNRRLVIAWLPPQLTLRACLDDPDTCELRDGTDNRMLVVSLNLEAGRYELAHP
jgi:DNA-binding HxlR family transcriptional regulator